ncbi:Cof-type HAD-IIB family hydrolase [Alkaliphilus peptidifermentans]|uniref:Cof subfamily of IIB subfamily of haloacid dehalogenase superfamily/HAD-superfamily hydrolase, subfamily IIB n=1 Tax=Alkaliphilus peptidifermentans DSM 18978 TaxID=1120976 RepID=A0A1G5KMY4_9FIRM|nr:Cof-type HAD-IIB family hydrolase [Alkaliphilus peptidifermentans]SCZ01986.1 hypothetical protein SAMN03080606_03623 [Alkaliphilus peptidifermentans DSM 18978]
MSYKLVAIDIDGTLLNSNHVIPEENIETIRQLREKGVSFVIVTGRPDTAVKEYVETLGINAPVLGCNGASIRDVLTGKIHSLKTIPNDILIKLYEFFHSRNIYPRYYSLDSVYSFNTDEFNEAVNPFAVFSKRLAGMMSFKVIKDIDFLLKWDTKIVKVVYITEEYETIAPIQEELRKIPGIEALRSTKTGLDIFADDVSKGKALLSYAESLGIKKEEIIAIGDGENDLSMLEAVGFPVTLKNGEEALKEIAKFVSNDEAGVAKALKKIYKYNEDSGDYDGV